MGTGKTMLATELLYRAWRRGRSIWWVRAGQLVAERHQDTGVPPW